MPQFLDDLSHALIDAALKAGAQAADAIAIRGQSVIVDMRGGTLEQAERAEGTDIGLRVLIGGRQANVSASDTRPETIEALAPPTPFSAVIALLTRSCAAFGRTPSVSSTTRWASCFAFCKEGSRMLTSKLIMAITTSNSISVKPPASRNDLF